MREAEEQVAVPMLLEPAEAAAVRRRRFGGLWYARLPADPPPNELAAQLHRANVARQAAKRLDDYERMEAQAREHTKAKVKACLGTACVVLGVAPAVPGTIQSCPTDPSWICALRIGAIIGGATALGLSVWAAYELSRTNLHIEDHIQRLNDAIHRTLMARQSDINLDNLFTRYRGMSRSEQVAFKAFLHEHAKQPKQPTHLTFAQAANIVAGGRGDD